MGKDNQRIKVYFHMAYIDIVTRLKLYNYLNLTELENIYHKDDQVVVEIPNNCLPLFT